MYPILGRYGPFFLYSYTVLMGLGLFAGIGVSAWQARRGWWPDWLDGLLSSLAVALVGGRAGFVLAQWGYFQERPSEMWQVWLGGLSYHGALLAGLSGLWVWCAWRGRPFERLASLLAPGFALASAFGWLACWLEGCAYGREASSGLLTAALPDTFGVFAVRYQTQLMGLGLSLIIFFIALWRQPKWPAARSFWFTLIGLSAGRMVVTLFRADAVLQVGQVRADTIADGAMALAFLILLQYRSRTRISDSTAVKPLSGPPHAGQAGLYEGQDET